jgi:hypothetical protein
MTKHPHASPLTLLVFRIGIALLVVPILALTLYGQAFYGSVVGTMTDQSTAVLRADLQVHIHAGDLQNGVQPRSETSTSTLGDL